MLTLQLPQVQWYYRENFSHKGIFEFKQVNKSASGSENNIKLKNGIFSQSRLKSALSSEKKNYLDRVTPTLIGLSNLLQTIKSTNCDK